ncbi:hypothetical protein [Solemya velesiana gill symbiont]|uniref:Uncharacterized protein n=1 Tax=Solemya velesiana gill symbiont TaxID=1918948 RepID=A0A1T2KWG4_9GAMM|nr:hypothetical protein [Solemya velesiana gill symbiont]OOZ37199.1 hypothetical protein BOW51_03530 [Solemya velesiana gill symbiont]
MSSIAGAADLDYPNRYGTLAESMMDMMDAFSSAYQKRKGSDTPGFDWPQNNFGSMPGFSPSMSPFSPYGMPGSMSFSSFGPSPYSNPWGSMQQFNQFKRAPSATKQLDGDWRGQAGDVLVINNGRFRIFRDRSNFREGRIHIENDQHLLMQDLASGQSLRYEYAEQEGRLALRDEWGNLMLYRRISR